MSDEANGAVASDPVEPEAVSEGAPYQGAQSQAEPLTLRKVIENGGVVTVEMVEPFADGEGDARDISCATLVQAVNGHVRYLDSVDRETRMERLDEPILTVPSEEANGESV